MTSPRKFSVAGIACCAAGMLVLLGLGIWQVDRLSWKNNLQKELDRAFAMEIPPPLSPETLNSLKKNEIRRGTLSVKPDFASAFMLQGKIADGRPVYPVVVPASFGTDNHILVEIGCSNSPDNLSGFWSLESWYMNVTGVAMRPDWTYFTPPNQPAQGDWWRLDTVEIARYLKLPTLVPVILIAENSDMIAPGLKACQVEHQLRNEHLSYALFWFTLAVALAVIGYLRFIRGYLQSA